MKEGEKRGDFEQKEFMTSGKTCEKGRILTTNRKGVQIMFSFALIAKTMISSKEEFEQQK